MSNRKRKMLSFGLALSLLVGSFMGLIGSAAAADPLPASANTLISRLNAVYGYLSVADKAKIDTARTAVQAALADNNRVNNYGSISNPIWTRINNKINGSLAYPNATQLNVLDFGLNFGAIYYDPTFTDLAEYRETAGFIGLITDLQNLANVDDAVDFEDITSFYLAVETATRSTIQSMPNFTSFADLISFKNALETAVQNVINAKATNLAKIFFNLGITADDLLDSKTNLQLEIPSALDAELALAKAYQSMINATATPTPSPVPTSSPAPTTVSDDSQPDEDPVDPEEVLNELADKLPNLPANEKKEELKKAEDAVKKAVKEAAKVEVNVTVDGGKAKPDIKENDILNKVKEAKAKADELNKDLEDLGGKKVKLEVSIDLGEVNSNDAEVPLNKSLLKGLSDNGADSVAVGFNGVEVALDVNEFDEDTTLNIKKLDKNTVPETNNQKPVSDPFEFNFTSGGEEVEKFKKPVELRLPVQDTSSIDTDLLSIAKIIEDRLQMYGGIFDNGSVTVKRNSFSTYVVVENKVTFEDIASVNSWAGRSIEVAAAKGIIVGDGQGSFNPSDKVTRAEFAKLLVTAFSLSDPQASESFADVNDNDWFKSYVAIAVSKGIISGRTAAEFDPNAPVSRQEMAAMIARALKSELEADTVEDTDAALAAFDDAKDVLSGLKADVSITVNEGVMVGSGGKFNPNMHASRAEAAVVIKKLIDLL